jgi:hypothetical protein
MKNEKIGRNERCQCNSGLKYKNCCGKSKPSVLDGLPTGLRMKGGVRSNPNGKGFIAIVHVWDNIECQGAPTEWSYPEIFDTEDNAMGFYKNSIRPQLEQLMSRMKNSSKTIITKQRKLE